MKKNIYSVLGLFILTSCMNQLPAPIEFGSSKSSSSGYSERTSSAISDESGIKRRELVGNKSSQPTGELRTKEEAFTEYKELKASEEKVLEDEVSAEGIPEETLSAKEKKLEQKLEEENKRLKSLEEEMEEIEEAHASKADTDSKVKNEEIIKPEKVVMDEVGDRAEEGGSFAMPVRGKIITKFGEDKKGKKSNGIDISAARGSDVNSIADGKVVYAGQDPKFGNLVIIKVGSTEMFAAYAHMDDLLLEKDEDVTKGQVIGHVGTTGDVTNPELHFAIRKGKTPVDPMAYLITK